MCWLSDNRSSYVNKMDKPCLFAKVWVEGAQLWCPFGFEVLQTPLKVIFSKIHMLQAEH